MPDPEYEDIIAALQYAARRADHPEPETRTNLSEHVERAVSRGILSIRRGGKPIDPQRLRKVTEQMSTQADDAAMTVRRMRGDERY